MTAVAIPSEAAPAEAHPVSAVAPNNVAHKFGGSSLANTTRIAHVAQLVRARPETTQVVVVSAMQGVTDALLGLTAPRSTAIAFSVCASSSKRCSSQACAAPDLSPSNSRAVSR